MSQHDVFVSYSSRDAEIASGLVALLRKRGLKCFISERDISAGDAWEDTIREAIRGADKVLLLITPRSKNSLWVAAEAGAAWALDKTLIAALMFVEPEELIDPIRRQQARLVETQEQVEAFVAELASPRKLPRNSVAGQWFDPEDNDTIFYRQVGSNVVGYYNYGSGNKKVGQYLGKLKAGVLNYSWRWLDRDLDGHGRLQLSPDGKRLTGFWWYDDDKAHAKPMEMMRVSDAMPPWLRDKDFQLHDHFLKHGKLHVGKDRRV